MDHGVSIVRLADRSRGVEVSIAPGIGNRAYRMKVHGNDILHFPSADASELQKQPELCGIPLLAPWAGLLSERAFWANGKKYSFNMALGNVRGRMPSHGLLTASPPWRVVELKAGGRSARVTSRLEFWKHPDPMAQRPFTHEYEMTYSLAGGVLEVKTVITNLSAEAMPVAIAYHPYFRIPGVPRDEWLARYPARIHVIPGEHNIPAGELRPLDIPNPLPLQGCTLDDGFAGFERDAAGRAHFSIEAPSGCPPIAPGSRASSSASSRPRPSSTASVRRTKGSGGDCRACRRAKNGQGVSGSAPKGSEEGCCPA